MGGDSSKPQRPSRPHRPSRPPPQVPSAPTPPPPQVPSAPTHRFGPPRRSVQHPAYVGSAEFGEALHVPELPHANCNKMDGITVLFPLLDVSGSMHNKLQAFKDGLCNEVLRAVKPNVVAAMAFTEQQYTLADFSGYSEDYFTEFEGAIRSVFIPSQSGTDIPAALVAMLAKIQAFLQPLDRQSVGCMWRAYCVVVTDGIHKVEDAQWRNLENSCMRLKQLAREKRCFLFFQILNLQSDDVGEVVLKRLAAVLEAERSFRAQAQMDQLYDAASRHMVTLEKCVNEINDIKKDVQRFAKASSYTNFQKSVLPRFHKAKTELHDLKKECDEFQPQLKSLESAIQPFVKEMLSTMYQRDCADRVQPWVERVHKAEELLASSHNKADESLSKVRDLASTQQLLNLESDTERISMRLKKVEQFAQRNVNQDMVRDEVVATIHEADENLEKVSTFLSDNKNQQFESRGLLLRVQKDREKAYALSRKLKFSKESDWIVADAYCAICANEGVPSRKLACQEQHAACFQCLTKVIEVATDENRPAKCPHGCSHELFEHEVQDICEQSSKDELADKYLGRCLSRRLEAKDSTHPCPKKCGNQICSVDSDVGICDRCGYKFCPKCMLDPHPAFPNCRLYIQSEIEKSQKEDSLNVDELQNTLATFEFMENLQLRDCPHCGFTCEKLGGCDWVMCAKCAKGFAWNDKKSARGLVQSAHGLASASSLSDVASAKATVMSDLAEEKAANQRVMKGMSDALTESTSTTGGSPSSSSNSWNR